MSKDFKIKINDIKIWRFGDDMSPLSNVNYCQFSNVIYKETSSETQGQLVGRETKSKRAGKNSTSKKYKLKIGAPGDKHCTDQFQTAEQILAPDWAENLLYFSAQSAGSKG